MHPVLKHTGVSERWAQVRGETYLAPACSKTVLRRFSMMKRPDVAVATATNVHRRISYGKMHTKLMGINTLRAYPAGKREALVGVAKP